MLSLCVLALRLDVLRYDAWHDPLTGLFDRRSFDRLLEMAIARSNRYGWPFTLVMLDLDHFKHDQRPARATRPATRRCASSASASGGCCASATTRRRIGGDEFAMILPEHRARPRAGAARPRPHAPTASSARARRSRSVSRSARTRRPSSTSSCELADTRLYEAKERVR